MKLKNIRYMKKVKGSVLFTVIVVMFVMLIMVTATLSLAANASNRAYSNYMKNQATYTARSAVNSTIQKLQEDSKITTGSTMASEIIDYLQTNSSIELQVNQGTSGGYGTIEKVVITKTGKKDDLSGYYIRGSKEDIMKVTAYVNMGNKQVTYSQYVNSSSSTIKPTKGINSFIAVNGYSGSGSTAPRVIGPQSSNVAALSTVTEIMRNPAVFYGDKFFNSPVEFNTHTTFNLGRKQGIAIWGDLTFDSNAPVFKSMYNYADEPTVPSNEELVKLIPYLYVDGTLKTNTSELQMGSLGNPMNLYVGSLITGSKPTRIYGDVYIYDSTIESIIHSNEGSNLLNWYEGTDGSTIGGSLYSKGNVRFTSNTTINGDLYVDGTITVDGSTLTVKGSCVYGDVGTGSDVKINCVKKSKKVSVTTLFPTYLERDKITEISKVDTDGNGTNDSYQAGPHKFIQTMEDMHNLLYEEPLNPGAGLAFEKEIKLLKDEIIQKGDSFPTYTGGTISSNTKISGTVSNSIEFKNITGLDQEINVILDGVNVQSGANFIVDETNLKVNFWIKNGATFNGNKIITDAYNNKIGGDFEIRGDATDADIPKLNIYSYDDSDITFNSNCIVTGNIFAPRSKLTWKMGWVVPGKVTYKYNFVEHTDPTDPTKSIYTNDEYTTINNSQVALIGSAIVGTIEELQNDVVIFILANNGSTSGGTKPTNYKWTPIEGYSNY